jgi:hypothetical protein
MWGTGTVDLLEMVPNLVLGQDVKRPAPKPGHWLGNRKLVSFED